MPSVPWYRVARGFPSHEKTLHLADLLGDYNAGMYMLRLFDHCADRAHDGRVHKSVVEGAAGWRGKKGKFTTAAMEARFLEPDGDRFIVHGFEERNGAVIRKALADAQKPRGNTASPGGQSPGPPGDHLHVPGGKSAGQPQCPGGVEVRSKKEEEKKHAAVQPASTASEGDGPGLASTAAPSLPNDDAAVVDLFRIAFSERCAMTRPDWFGISRRELVAETRSDLAAEIRRLGIPRAVDVCFPSYCRTKSKWLRLYLSDLQGAMREEPQSPRAKPPAAVTDERWGAVLEKLQATLRPDLFERWIAPLVGHVNGQVELQAPNVFDAAFVRDNYGPAIEGFVADALGQRLAVVIKPEAP